MFHTKNTSRVTVFFFTEKVLYGKNYEAKKAQSNTASDRSVSLMGILFKVVEKSPLMIPENAIT